MLIFQNQFLLGQAPTLLWAHAPEFSLCDMPEKQAWPLLCLSFQTWKYFLFHALQINESIHVVVWTLNIHSFVREIFTAQPWIQHFTYPTGLLSRLKQFQQEFPSGKDLAQNSLLKIRICCTPTAVIFSVSLTDGTSPFLCWTVNGGRFPSPLLHDAYRQHTMVAVGLENCERSLQSWPDLCYCYLLPHLLLIHPHVHKCLNCYSLGPDHVLTSLFPIGLSWRCSALAVPRHYHNINCFY